MGKIKGWKKYSETNNRIVWTNINKFKGNFLDVQFFTNNWMTEANEGQKLIYSGKNKKQALDYAMNYMRSHPNG